MGYFYGLLTILSILVIHHYAEDICFLPHLDHNGGVCDSAKKRYFFNNITQRCEGFVYKGCGHNENHFKALRNCRERCEDRICKLPLDFGGFCTASHMYHYDLHERKCKLFTYGGCGGNANRFSTPEKCLDTCSHVGYY